MQAETKDHAEADRLLKPLKLLVRMLDDPQLLQHEALEKMQEALSHTEKCFLALALSASLNERKRHLDDACVVIKAFAQHLRAPAVHVAAEKKISLNDAFEHVWMTSGRRNCHEECVGVESGLPQIHGVLTFLA